MKFKSLIAVLFFSFFMTQSHGGLVQPAPVLVDTEKKTALGDMASARYSDNEVEFIGCGVRYTDQGDDGVFSFGFCQAANSDGVNASCKTQKTALIDAIKTVAHFSFISFSWDDDGNCTHIGASTQSFYIR